MPQIVTSASLKKTSGTATGLSLNSGNRTASASQTSNKGYKVYSNEKYGKYIDAGEFGTDKSGKTDSLNAIKAALTAADKEGAAVYLSGKLYISDQIVIGKSLSKVTGLFGDGMGKTEIKFDKAQTGVFNSDSNHDDIRAFAGILVDHTKGVTIGDLSVKYTRANAFYVKGQSYFGKVSGILVNDSDNTLITGVEVSGANRAGIQFTSTDALTRDTRTGSTYKMRAALGQLDENDSRLPLGENNRVEKSKLHHNRVAGILVAYQEDFVADGNTLSWNGHAADGGTGYGIATMAGSYNFGVTFSNNRTDHNYRKGLDAHDGNDITITGNTSNGDRLYGITVYNRQFAMDKVKISNNTVIQDPKFRLFNDDDAGRIYHGYSGIQVQTNTQRVNLHTKNDAVYEISNNTVKGLSVYQNAVQTYGIEFRNHEHSIDYTANITGNVIEGSSSKYLIAVINDTSLNDRKGAGSGTINISGNKAEIGQMMADTVPIYVEEKNVSGQLRGSVTVSDNNINILKSNGVVEGVQLIGNAETYTVTDNKIKMLGTLDKSIISVIGKSDTENVSVTISDNAFTTGRRTDLYSEWVQIQKASYVALDNTHNGKAVGIRSNLEGSHLSTFQAAKAKADAADSELTTIFDIEPNAFKTSSLFTAYDAAVKAHAGSYAYADAGSFTVDTAEHLSVI